MLAETAQRRGVLSQCNSATRNKTIAILLGFILTIVNKIVSTKQLLNRNLLCSVVVQLLLLFNDDLDIMDIFSHCYRIRHSIYNYLQDNSQKLHHGNLNNGKEHTITNVTIDCKNKDVIADYIFNSYGLLIDTVNRTSKTIVGTIGRSKLTAYYSSNNRSIDINRTVQNSNINSKNSVYLHCSINEDVMSWNSILDKMNSCVTNHNNYQENSVSIAQSISAKLPWDLESIGIILFYYYINKQFPRVYSWSYLYQLLHPYTLILLKNNINASVEGLQLFQQLGKKMNRFLQLQLLRLL